jgi:preprotein translocase subunit SecB
MSETTPAPLPQGSAPQAGPPLVVNIQFVKDLSFEVPGAPEIFSSLRAQPNVQINLDVQARRLQEGQSVFEVALVVKAEATEGAEAGSRAVFIAELTYAGVFTLNNIPEASVEPVLLIECPRLLFPFARNILADVTRDGGFPPVLLQPIDFVSLWQARKAQSNGASVSV